MKSIKYIAALAVLFVGIGFSAYAGDDGISDHTSGALNINTATAQELSMLPFVDRETAMNIVIFRDSNGPFSSIDELKKVKGISRILLDDLRGHLKVEGSSNFDPYGAVYGQ